MCKLEAETDPKSHGNLRSCDDGWVRYEDSCIFVQNEEDYFYENAEAYCLENSASLVRINSDNKRRFIATLLPTQTHVKQNYWIGLQKLDHEWVWSDGSTLGNYENWVVNEPSDKLCVETDWRGFWISSDCTNNRLTICEKPAGKEKISQNILYVLKKINYLLD